MPLSLEDKKFIKNLSYEMKTQDNRSTAQPYALVIQEDEMIFGMDPNYSSYIGAYWNESVYTEDLFDDFVEHLKDYKEEDLLEKIRTNDIKSFSELTLYDDDEVINNAEVNISGYQLTTKRDGSYSGNLFLTEKSALQYIEGNRHNLSNPVTYGVHLYRNPEMGKLYEIIHKLAEEF